MNLSYWCATWVILVPSILYASWVDGKEKRVPNWLQFYLGWSGGFTLGHDPADEPPTSHQRRFVAHQKGT